MNITRQYTVRHEISASGVGVHSGKQVLLTLRPAPVDTGIVFRRVDFDQPVEIRACVDYVGDTLLSTCLVNEQCVRVATIEHLMSAFLGLGIDNAYVDLTEAELPFMDGSAYPFVFLIQSAGIQQQDAPRRFIQIERRIEVCEGDKWASLEPFAGSRISVEIVYPHLHSAFSSQNCRVDIDISKTTFIKEISRARTFGFKADVDTLRKRGLILGGSLRNAIVFNEEGLINKEGLRFPNECVLHKILDAMGDMYLLGAHFIGAFSGYKSGHALNNKLLRTLLNDSNAWKEVYG